MSLLIKFQKLAPQSILSEDILTKPPEERAKIYKEFIEKGDQLIKALHQSGGSGIEVAESRGDLLDITLQAIFENAREIHDDQGSAVSMIAVGGFGRGLLNPGSDIDLLFLLPKASHKISSEVSEFVQSILYILWDVGFKVGHATRSISECVSEAKTEQQSKTALMDARLLAGDSELFEEFQKRFKKECIEKDPEAFFQLRRSDLHSRHLKYSKTVFLQEPNVKESCGGLRDYHNILWIAEVKRNTRDINQLVTEKIITKQGLKEIKAAHDFLHRVRNDLHYETGKSTDILTLRLQGVVATNFNYPEESILRRCESFMRDYYRHTRALYHITWSVMQTLEIEIKEEQQAGWKSMILGRGKNRQKVERFDECTARNELLYPSHSKLFQDDPTRLMRVFLHCQKRQLHFSPQMRKTIIASHHLIDRDFRYNKANRETFRAILERKGEVAQSLRQMHRVGFLGLYLPEFGAMDCLVQHEFFHRYTADEHTLRCIDQLDALIENTSKEKSFYRNLLQDIEDPYALYLALILHDSGRAEDVREHIDGSAMLASQVCSRFQIRGSRRGLLTWLVDHHLTYWRHATSRNLEDPEVIEEFASIMGTEERLNALLLFTYADSNGTNEEAWSPWKETLMLQLYYATREFLKQGKHKYSIGLEEEKEELRKRTKQQLNEKYHKQLDQHFESMPDRYFRFRRASNVAIHVRAARRFLINSRQSENVFEVDLRWINRDDRGYSELIVTTWNKPLLLEKICCALATEELNIISADVFTRTDGVVCDIFHVCTTDHTHVSDKESQKRIKRTLADILAADSYDPSKYLKKKKNFLRKDDTEMGIPFPVTAYVNNKISPIYNTVVIQALDRIGLLHDLFRAIDQAGFATVHARICTEKGAAMDTIYVTHPDGHKEDDPEALQRLEEAIQLPVMQH